MRPADRLSFPILLAFGVTIALLLLGSTWLIGWGFGVYTIRWATDLLFTFSLCHTLMGLTLWIGRGLRFYLDSNGFKAQVFATDHDRLDLNPRQRAWWLLVHENQLLIPWVGVGLLLMLLAVLFGVVLRELIPPDTILLFMVRKDLLDDIPPELLP